VHTVSRFLKGDESFSKGEPEEKRGGLKLSLLDVERASERGRADHRGASLRGGGVLRGR